MKITQIAGFLGCGKTTLLLKLSKQLADDGERPLDGRGEGRGVDPDPVPDRPAAAAAAGAGGRAAARPG